MLRLGDLTGEPVQALADHDLVRDGGFVPDVRCLETGRDLGVSLPCGVQILRGNGLAIGCERRRGQAQEHEQDEGDAYCHCLAINSTIVDGPAAPAENLTFSSANSLFN